MLIWLKGFTNLLRWKQPALFTQGYACSALLNNLVISWSGWCGKSHTHITQPYPGYATVYACKYVLHIIMVIILHIKKLNYALDSRVFFHCFLEFYILQYIMSGIILHTYIVGHKVNHKHTSLVNVPIMLSLTMHL